MKYSLLPLLAALCAIGWSQTPHKPTPEMVALAKEQKSRDAVKAQFSKHPHDPQLAHKFVVVNDKLAYQTMTCDGLTPHQRYSTALQLYRQTLKVDPKDPDANKWVDMIVSIYKQMHRPVPQ